MLHKGFVWDIRAARMNAGGGWGQAQTLTTRPAYSADVMGAGGSLASPATIAYEADEPVGHEKSRIVDRVFRWPATKAQTILSNGGGVPRVYADDSGLTLVASGHGDVRLYVGGSAHYTGYAVPWYRGGELEAARSAQGSLVACYSARSLSCAAFSR